MLHVSAGHPGSLGVLFLSRSVSSLSFWTASFSETVHINGVNLAAHTDLVRTLTS